MQKSNFKLKLILALLPVASLCRAENQVYIENHTKSRVTTLVNATNGQHTITTKANDKDWIHCGNGCIHSIVVKNADGQSQYAVPSAPCSNLSIYVAQGTENVPIITKMTNQLKFKGSAVAFSLEPEPSSPPANASEITTQIGNAPIAQPASKEAITVPGQKGPYSVYVENHAEIPITTQVFLEKGSSSKTTKPQDKDWVRIKNQCIQYIEIKTSNTMMRFDFPNGRTECTNLSLLVTLDPTTGKLLINNATYGLNFQGPVVDGYKISYPAFTPQGKVDYQVYVQNEAKIDIDVHVYTKNGQMVPQKVSRHDKEWIHLKDQCIDYFIIYTVNQKGTFRFPPQLTTTCTYLSLLINVDDQNRPIIVNSGNYEKGSGVKGNPITGWQITYDRPLFEN